jgi:hypothetical protein
MNCVDHPVAVREHHKRAVDIFIQSEKCTSSGNMVRCVKVCSVNKFLCEVCHTGSVWSMLMPWEQLWYNALDNNRKVNTVEDRQPICMPSHVHSGCLSVQMLLEGADELR